MKIKHEDKMFLIFILLALAIVSCFGAYHGIRQRDCHRLGGKYFYTNFKSICVKQEIVGF